MRMKKILLVMAAMLCVATVSAQSKWAAGLRIGSGLQAQGEYTYADNRYVEARFGMGWFGGINADFTALHNWNVCNWDWTPSVGSWYLDAGVGINIGGGAKTLSSVYYEGYYAGWVHGTTVYGGVAGQVKFGIKFKKVPIRLSIDYTPVLGVAGSYANAAGKKELKEANAELEAMGEPGRFKVKDAHFYGAGLGNFGISATYCF